MKFILSLLVLSIFSSAQTGPVVNTATKRTLICCGKATNQISTPAVPTSNTIPTKAIKQ